MTGMTIEELKEVAEKNTNLKFNRTYLKFGAMYSIRKGHTVSVFLTKHDKQDFQKVTVHEDSDKGNGRSFVCRTVEEFVNALKVVEP
jgi:hypothetical protein